MILNWDPMFGPEFALNPDSKLGPEIPWDFIFISDLS